MNLSSMENLALPIVIALMATQGLQVNIICPQEIYAGSQASLYIIAYNPFSTNVSIEMLEVSTPNRTYFWIIEGNKVGVVRAGQQTGIAQYTIIVPKEAPSGTYLINILMEYRAEGQVQWYQQSIKVRVIGYYGDTSILIMRAESLLYNTSMNLSILERERDFLKGIGANTSSIDLIISGIRENITSAGELISSSKNELNRGNYGEASYLAEKAISILNSTLNSINIAKDELKNISSARKAEIKKEAESSIIAARSRVYTIWNEAEKLKKENITSDDKVLNSTMMKLWGIMSNITAMMERANSAYSSGNYSLSIELSEEVISMVERAEKLISDIYDRINLLNVKNKVEAQVNRTESLIAYCRESLRSIYPTISWNKTAVSAMEEINRTLDEAEAELRKARSLIESGDYYSAYSIASELSNRISSVLSSLDSLKNIERAKVETESPSPWGYIAAISALSAFLAIVAVLLRIRR